ncbi:MAG: aminotransferase class III-fold pyridoxal phosphate-dependent enzyme, partial [Clostridiales bacterium]|nr:aminotransferase class III-fold pyridoxal phosphate-dependent enzyme [Clostridiales bacterium]
MNKFLEDINSIGDEKMREYSKNLMVGGGFPGPCLVGGKGVRAIDSNGKSYIDCTSQSWALYLGYANQEITGTVHDHMKNLSHVHQGFHTKIRYTLANRLAKLAPENLNRVSFTVGGGPAVEAAMKIALKNVKDSRNFISLWDAYHGNTLTAAGASWTTTKASGSFTGMKNFLPDVNNNFVRVPNPYCYRCIFGQKPGSCNVQCAEMLKQTMQRGVNGPVAGVILEPIQGSGGQIPCPKKYLQRAREICDEFGALLIFDEIQTYCRIGKFFAAEYFD